MYNAPTGFYDVLSGTKQGKVMDWINGPGVATVRFGGEPGFAVISVGVIVYHGQGSEYIVAGNTLTPVPDSYTINANAGGCGSPPCIPEDELTPLVTGPMTFEYTSATTVTLSGSGIVLYLRARPEPTGASPG